MREKDGKPVTLRPMGNKEGLEAEPEMIELKEMVQTGEVDRDRAVSYLDAEVESHIPTGGREGGSGLFSEPSVRVYSLKPYRHQKPS